MQRIVYLEDPEAKGANLPLLRHLQLVLAQLLDMVPDE
jgi:hypothetical protein